MASSFALGDCDEELLVVPAAGSVVCKGSDDEDRADGAGTTNASLADGDSTVPPLGDPPLRWKMQVTTTYFLAFIGLGVSTSALGPTMHGLATAYGQEDATDLAPLLTARGVGCTYHICRPVAFGTAVAGSQRGASGDVPGMQP